MRDLSRNQKSPTTSAISGSIMLIGIIILAAVDSISFFPWILLVLAAASVPSGVEAAGLWGVVPSISLGVLTIFIAMDRAALGVVLILSVGVALAIYNRTRKK